MKVNVVVVSLILLCLTSGNDVFGTATIYAGLPTAFQQTVTGTVTDGETGEPMPGVSVLVQGTNMGIATDTDGEYTLEVPGPEAVLEFSFVGYRSQEIVVGDQEVIDVSLEVDLGRLDEMIVIGYGTVQRRDLTGSVDRIDSEDIRDQQLTQISEALAGTVAGLNVTQSTDAAGGATMEIRGQNSLLASTDPLIVLDGTVYHGSLRDINPHDIETIDILKDASSATAYGASAASGVVLLTTTRGTRTEPTVSFSQRFSHIQVRSYDYAVRGPDEYIDFRRDFLRTAGEDTEPDVFWDHPDEIREGWTLEEWRNINQNPLPDDEREWLSRMNFFPTEIEQYLAGETIDWGRKVMPSGIQSESNLSVSGGSPTSQYYWSIGFIDNEGLVRGDQFAAVRSRLNVNFTIADWLDIGANVQYSDRDESAVSASVSSMQLVSPFARMYDEDGTPKWYPGDYIGGPNPLEGTLGTDRDRRNTNLYGDLHMEVDLPYNISSRVSFQPRYLNQRDYRFWSPETRIGGESFNGGRADRREWQEFEWMVDVQLMWDRDIGVHSFDATALFTAEEERTWFNNITNNTFEPSPVLGFHGIDFGSNPSFNVNDEKVTGNGMMARLQYSLLDKYLITGTFRRDGYSAFGSEFPKANFPSVAFAWQVAQEDFFNVDLVNELKLRLSWGMAGNREIGPYSALARMTSNQYYDGSRVHMGVTTSNLANRALRWEETESINVGLDIGILEHRINLTLDYYDMTTSNLLVNRTLPRLTGFDDVTTNIGELDNRGYEMTLRTVNVSTPDLTWSTRLNLGLNRNKISTLFGDQGTYILQGKEFEGELPDFANAWFPGRSIHAIWDYNIEGMWQEEEAAEAAEYNLSPGDFKATDLSGSGTYEAVHDKMFIGYTEPRYRLGLRNRLSWRNFTATAFIRADLGHKLPFNDATAGHSTFDRRNTPPFPYWTPENRSNEWPRLARNESPFGGGIELYKDASFVRLQDLSLSYQVPMEMAGRLMMQNLRFTASVRNLFTITNWDGFDPESQSPMPRTITLGINLSI